MAKGRGQKLKMLYIKEILEQYSDEEHPLGVQDIIDMLEARGVDAERKTVYDDLAALQDYGMDVIMLRQGRRNVYYLGERTFQLPELKLLVDAAQSAKFITEKKSRELIGKISSLASHYGAALMARQVYVQGRVKTMNESIYYNVDLLQNAIAVNRQIRCRYYEWVVDFTQPGRYVRSWRRGGAPYLLSPWAMLWDDENYYLLGYDESAGIIKHYRVDKLAEITLLETPRAGRETFEALDMAAYTKRRFGMFGGEEIPVRLRFANRLVGVVVDRFGKDISIHKAGEGYFTVSVRAVLSPQFVAWVLGFGDEAQVQWPPEAVAAVKDTLQKTGRLYGV